MGFRGVQGAFRVGSGFYRHPIKVTVQFEWCFQLMVHISVISRRDPTNLYITENLLNSLNSY